jgi:hypothetical protein
MVVPKRGMGFIGKRKSKEDFMTKKKNTKKEYGINGKFGKRKTNSDAGGGRQQK